MDTSELKTIDIGSIIHKHVDMSAMSYAEFARRINRSRPAVYSLFRSKSIDIELLLHVSEVLNYDFLSEIYHIGSKTDTINSALIIPFVNGKPDVSGLPSEVKNILREALNAT